MTINKAGVHFGLGYNPDNFPIEAAEFLERQNELQGNVLNTSMAQGDLLIWKAYPQAKDVTSTTARACSRATLLDEWRPDPQGDPGRRRRDLEADAGSSTRSAW